jgi:acetyl-CoA carboxylase biotin carboxylase subunit
LREEMGAAAVRAAEAVDYLGAGTVEFLYKDGEFFFLEMNTRLQVEHPVTELVYGVDLVELQLRVAAGEALTLEQGAILPTGHSIECRITSEDPHRGFLPSTGRIDYLRFPGGPGVRWDGGIINGFEIGLHYDPLLGKLIVHAPSRDSAIRRMARALDEIVIRGVETCVPFHRRVMDEGDFQRGDLSIQYLEEHADIMEGAEEETLLRGAAATAALLQEKERNRLRVTPTSGGNSPGFSAWKRAGPPFSGRR